MEENQFNYPDVFITSEKTDLITKALVQFNDSIGNIDKSAKNPFFRSDYAPLPDILKAIKNPMVSQELTINHFPIGDNRLVTRLSHTSGQFYQSMFYMKSVKDTPQDRGSVITYMMRYAVGAILGLSIDKDDDGNSSTFNKKQSPVQPTKKTMTVAVQKAMLKYVEDGNLDAVTKQLPKYTDGKLKTEINKAITDAKNLAELESSDVNDKAISESLNPKK